MQSTQQSSEQQHLPPPAVWALSGLYLISAAVLLYALSAVWPSEAHDANRVSFFFWTLPLSGDVRLLWLVVVTSALGSYIHTVTSFTIYAGRGALSQDWLAWYFLRPAVSAALALIFYFCLRAGLFAGSTADQTINPFGIAAISGMVGMFAKQATEKLGKIFDTIFT
jgi:hypothetical protein